jgi:serine protease Do
VETLRRGGQVVRGFLGVTLQPLDDDMARAVGLRQQEGALVAEVTTDGPAARAGIQTGDVILRADGERVSDSRDLARAVAAHRPGSRLRLDVLRSGRRMQATATLAAMPPDAVAQRPNTGSVQKAGRAGLGINVAPAPGSGVQIVSVDPGSAAASRGLTPGDLILEAGGRPCASAADLERAANAARRDGRGALLLRVQTGDQARYVGLSLTGDG